MSDVLELLGKQSSSASLLSEGLLLSPQLSFSATMIADRFLSNLPPGATTLPSGAESCPLVDPSAQEVTATIDTAMKNCLEAAFDSASIDQYG